MNVFEKFLSTQKKQDGQTNGLSVIDKAKKEYEFSPSVLLGKGYRTEQFTVTATPIRIIFASQVKFFSIMVEAGENIYIGAQDVTATSGMLLPEGFASTFGVLENVEIWAVTSANSNTIHLLDMGLY